MYHRHRRVSVCVCLSHAGIVSKQLNAGHANKVT